MIATRSLFICISLGAATLLAADDFAAEVDAIEAAIGADKIVHAHRLDMELGIALQTRLNNPRPPYPKEPSKNLAPMLAAVKEAVRSGDLMAAYTANWELTMNLYRAARELPPSSRFSQLEEDLAQVTGNARGMRIAEVAYAALDANELAKASAYAKEMLAAPANGFNHGSAIYDGNQVMGLVALRQGSVSEAKVRLAASVESNGSPTLNSFGPTFLLAKALVEKGEREAVIAFLEACGKFWKADRGKLAEWSATIRGGGTPSFSRF